MRALLAGLALAAIVLGGAGATTLTLERRLAALAPGGLDIAALHYNPLTGGLVLAGVRARDAGGRERFRADEIVATARPLPLLLGSLVLDRVRMAGPRLTLPAATGLRLATLAAGGELPLRIEDLAVAGGSVVLEAAGQAGPPLRLREVDARLSRITTATTDRADIAFAVETVAYGTLVHLTGQPRHTGYALRVRARGLDVAALARDLRIRGLAALEAGRGEVDVELLLAQGCLRASGHAWVGDVVMALPGPGQPRLRARSLTVVADGVDLASGAGRIARLELEAPSLSLPLGVAAATFAALAEPLRLSPELLLRRVAITDGTLVLSGTRGLRLEHLQLTAHAPERRGEGGWLVEARAALGDGAELALDGRLARDLQTLDARAQLHRATLGAWRALTGGPPDWDARVTFEGRVRAAVRGGPAGLTLTGQAVLADVSAAGRGGFRAERVALGIRRLQWPAADAVLDSVVLTRPAFALPVLTPWPRLLVAGHVSVVDGELREQADGRALRELEVSLAHDGNAAHLRLSASAGEGRRIGVDRLVPYETPGAAGVPLPLLLRALEEVARTPE